MTTAVRRIKSQRQHHSIAEEMTTIEIFPHQQFTAKTNDAPTTDRSTLEDQATPNPLYNAQHYAHHAPQHSKQEKVLSFLQIIKSKFFISCLILAAVFVTLLCIGLVVAYEKENDVTHTIDAWNDQLSAEQTVWFDVGLDELKIALQTKTNTRRAKNVVLFVGDGMGPNTATATRVATHGEDNLLSWEQFPHMGMLKTYCVDKLVPDSAVTATALFGGVKGNYETAGVDAAVPLADCSASLQKSNHVDSILRWAQDEGMGTGFVTTTRVVHATPAALYAHTADRRWECEAKMPEEALQKGCKDIARQLVEDSPGRDLNVIMGGGRQCLVSGITGTADDPLDLWSCVRADGRDLIEEWRTQKREKGTAFAVVQNRGELEEMDASAQREGGALPEHVMGIFANGHMKFEHQRANGSLGMPTLTEMTEAAIRLLSRRTHGFILVVEGGLIDQAHHRGWARRAIDETAALDAAVQRTVEMLKHEADETLIVVTADHTHTLSINGYPKRGSDIFGIAQPSKADGVPYTTLTYATGSSSAFQVEMDEAGRPRRRDPSTADTTAFDYVQQVAVATDENTHGGGDVTVHARGPMAHLFHRVHEQSYVAHVVSYAARIGRFRDNQLVQSFLDMLGIS